MGQPASYCFFTNTSGNTQTYDIELIEHWEVRGAAIEMLHTPSTSHETVNSCVKTIAQSARQHQSSNPQHGFGKVVKFVSNTLHNKAAMQGVEGLMMTALSLA